MKPVVIACLLGCVQCALGDVSLDGAWEMSYRPYSYEPQVECPSFRGVVVPNAVPGYWEDMRDAFRAAGLTDEFRVNPWYHGVRLPESSWADELTLPDIYGTFFYRRSFALDEVHDGVLCFEGVRNAVSVWINGSHLAARQGFSTPFEFKVPRMLLRTGTNEIVLAVSNNPNLGYLGAYVTGLTTRSLWRSTGGVNGHVALRFPSHDLRRAYVTTAADLKTFTVHLPDAKPVSYAVVDPADGRTVLSGTGKSAITLPTAGLRFWTPDDPRLYDLVLRANGSEERLPFGVRRLTARGEKLFLNGEPIYLRGVTEHCYFAKTVHLPRDRAYYEMITAKRKELGFNFVRFHTFVPPEEYFEATDRLGMLVHVESPNFVTEQEFEAIVRFARRHPSVVIYCTGNETRIDRLVEVYLRNVADIVHRETDALFSPMSALRGIEYALMPGKDPLVDKPFRHNAERAARVAAFSDLFTSYQLGATSYDSLNGRDAATLDRWGDAYGGRPRLSHEICIDGSYPDLSLERLYPADSPILRAGLFSEIRRVLGEKGLLGRADLYFRNSCQWMRRIRKHAFEKVRASDRTAGYDFLGDINTHWHTFGYFVGMMDEFYRLKPGETVADVLRYNSAAVVLTDLGSDFTVVAGQPKHIAFSVSNYAVPATNATLEVALVETGADGRVVFSRTLSAGTVPNGVLSPLGAVEIPMPAAATPCTYFVRAKLAGGALNAANEWELYAFPKVASAPVPAGVTVLETATKAELLARLAKGERVVLFGVGPFRSQATTFRIGMAGRCRGSFATVIADHPLFRDFPHEGFCGWQFRRLLEGGRAVQLEGEVPFDPIVDIASSEKLPIRQTGVFEYAVGTGRLLVCSFAFQASDPAAAWLRRRVLDYADSEAFRPRHAVTPAQLEGVIDHPEIVGVENANRARNPSDSSSEVRAGANALP